MTIREIEHIDLGSKFVEVLCITCRSPRNGEKTIFQQHKGYASSGGVDVTESEIYNAVRVAKDHDTNGEHDIRILVGK